MTRFLFDTGVFAYAVGAPHPYRDPRGDAIGRARSGELGGEASTDLPRELAHQRFRRRGDREQAVETARAAASLCRLHELRPQDVLHGLELHRANERPGPATPSSPPWRWVARSAPLSTDRAFDAVAGLKRVDPADTGALDALAS